MGRKIYEIKRLPKGEQTNQWKVWEYYEGEDHPTLEYFGVRGEPEGTSLNDVLAVLRGLRRVNKKWRKFKLEEFNMKKS